MQTLWLIIAAVFTLGWGSAGAASADEIDHAIADANAGRCDEAFATLSARGDLESRARLIVAQCRIRAGLYPEALNDLDRIRGASDLTPTQVGDVELYRAVAFYHLERFTEASAALGRAEGLSGEEAQVSLYSGLIALRNGDSDLAAPALERAARLSPEISEPVASYYAGLAWQRSAERAKARAAFERVVEIDGDGPWGKEAAKMLEASAPFPFYVNIRAGLEFDDNVVLRGRVSPTASGLAADGEEDFRGVWRINGGVELFDLGDLSGGVNGSYSGNAHQDLTEFNTHYTTVGAYLAQRIDSNTVAQAQYQYGFAWVDEESFLDTHFVELSLSHVWPKAGVTNVVADVIWSDLKFNFDDVLDETPNCPGPVPGGCGPNGLDEEKERKRDGASIGAGVSHTYPVNIPTSIASTLREMNLVGGYRFRYIASEGDEWKHFAHVFSAGIDVALPMKFRVGSHVSYEFRDFVNPSTYPDRPVDNFAYALSNADREEHEVRVVTEVAKDLTDHLSVSARWTYVNSESNRKVFDYSRHIVGGYLNFRFD